jgi:photosystem II stability/assembly factor-like uncharacterized protein
MGVLEVHFFDRNNGYAKVKLYGSRAGDLGQKILYSSDGGQHWAPSTWNGSASVGLPRELSNCAIQGNDVWVIGAFDKATTMGQDRAQSQYDFVLFHSRDGGASFASVGTLPNSAGQPKSIGVASQQGKPVLLMVDANGSLWRTFLPTNDNQ